MTMPWIAYPETFWLCVGIIAASLPGWLRRRRVMLRVTIKVNGAQLGLLRCLNIEGPDDGLCKYRCAYRDYTTGNRHIFEVMHWRPSGAPALVAAVMGMLAEAGVGRRDTHDVTRSEEGSDGTKQS